MSDRRFQVQVGALFFVSVTLLVLGILWFKEFKVGEKTYRVKVEFVSTSGLIKGDPVEVKGVPSGKVGKIWFEEGKAFVFLQLGRNVVLYSGTRIAITNMGLMGQKIVVIHPGNPQLDPLPPTTVHRGYHMGGIPEIMGGVGGALETFERLAARVDSLLITFDKSKQVQLSRTITNLESATSNLAQLLDQNRDELSSTITNMSEAMEDLHAMVDGRGEAVGQILDHAGSAAARLDTTLTAMDETVSRLNRVLVKVEDGDGTLGKVLEDDELYNQLVVTLRDARTLIEDVRENPKRYFKISIF